MIDVAVADELLTTTRTVRRRLDLDRPVEPEVIQRCIEIAIQAPTGSNAQHWRFVVVTDADKRQEIASYYRKAFDAYIKGQAAAAPQFDPDDPRAQRASKVARSAIYLARNLHRVPVFVIPCVLGRVEDKGVAAQASLYGSILPAAWSFMLALRARGLGAAWTTLHLVYEREVAAILSIPDDVTQAALLPVAYYKGETFRPAKRLPAEEVTFWNSWGARRAVTPGGGGQ